MANIRFRAQRGSFGGSGSTASAGLLSKNVQIGNALLAYDPSLCAHQIPAQTSRTPLPLAVAAIDVLGCGVNARSKIPQNIIAK